MHTLAAISFYWADSADKAIACGQIVGASLGELERAQQWCDVCGLCQWVDIVAWVISQASKILKGDTCCHFHGFHLIFPATYLSAPLVTSPVVLSSLFHWQLFRLHCRTYILSLNHSSSGPIGWWRPCSSFNSTCHNNICKWKLCNICSFVSVSNIPKYIHELGCNACVYNVSNIAL